MFSAEIVPILPSLFQQCDSRILVEQSPPIAADWVCTNQCHLRAVMEHAEAPFSPEDVKAVQRLQYSAPSNEVMLGWAKNAEIPSGLDGGDEERPW